jgi:hypothetical protein
MTEIIQKQTAKEDSNNIQIGVQNIYQGMSPQQAADLSIKLFYDNFPKLQEDAKKLIDERITEFTNGLISNLSKKGFEKFEVFSDPDMQYVLYEAQKGYARNGDMDLLSMLIATIEERCNAENNSLLKITLNESVNIIPRLLPQHINMITLVFLIRESVAEDINDFNTFKRYAGEIIEFAKGVKADECSNLHLIQLGVAKEIQLPNEIGVIFSHYYKRVFIFAPKPEKKGLTKFGINSKDILVLNSRNETVDINTYLISEIPEIEVLMDMFDNNKPIRYIGLTNIGRLIAIKNWEIKTGKKIDSSIWIK